MKRRLLATIMAVATMVVPMGVCSSVSMVASAEDSSEVEAWEMKAPSIEDLGLTNVTATGDYAYYNTSVYNYSISSVTVKDSESKVDYSTWTDEEGYTYGISKITVTHTNEGKKEEDFIEYRVTLNKIPENILSVDCTREVTIPDEVINILGQDIEESNKITVIGAKVFSGSYLKDINLGGVRYICDNAFDSCAYITTIDLPDTVRYVGSSVFQKSGLKTLNVHYPMAIVPKNLCSETVLSKVIFDYPESIEEIGVSAFAKTALTEVPNVGSDTPLLIGNNAFEGCTGMINATIPDNVYFISQSAFKGCSNLKTLSMGESLKAIDKEGFANCTSLTDISFNKSLTSLGGGVFSGCTSLVTVKGMPNGILDWAENPEDKNSGYGFGNLLFANCTSLKSVELPAYITVIPDSVFAGCTSLTSIVGGSNITAIGKDSFNKCSSLVDVYFPKVTEVGESSFNSCKSLSTVGESGFPVLETIGKNAFANCTELQSVDLTSVTSIDASAFSGCTELLTVSLPNCISVGNSAFANCTKMKEAVIDGSSSCGSSVFSKCTSLTKVKMNTSGMTITPESLFSGCTSLTTIDADLSNISIVGKNTFSGCSSLKTLSLDSAVIASDYCFSGCTSLESICEGDICFEDFGSNCFKGCSSLTQKVNSTASTIGSYAFSGSGISEVVINGTQGTTIVIGGYAFENCPNLTFVNINAPVDIKYSIGTNVFANCGKLNTALYSGPAITKAMFKGCSSLKGIKTNATIANGEAFSGCSKLEYILDMSTGKDIEAFDTIEDSAFKNCTSLKDSFSNADTVFTGNYQYSGCTSLKTADVSNLIGTEMFKDCTSLEKVTHNATAIGANAFVNCTSLNDINLEKVTSIGNNAFANSGIGGDLVLNVSNGIGSKAFYNCSNITSVKVYGTKIGDSAFEGCEYLSKANLYVKGVGASAFKSCLALRELEVLDNGSVPVESIGNYAFENCDVLMEAVVSGSASIGTKALGYSGSFNPEFMVISTEGSPAQTYAETNGILFGVIGEVDLNDRLNARAMIGDVDGNGVISIVDAVKLQAFINGTDVPSFIYKQSDVNNDGKVNVFDLISLQKKLKS